MIKIVTDRRFLFAVVVSVACIAFFFLSARVPQDNKMNGKIRVVSSIYPLSYVATAVGGDLASVHNLVPAGVEPHDFEPSARDLVEIGNADILIYNGASLEPWVKKWEQGSSVHPKHVVNMASMLKDNGVSLIQNGDAVDPHFWLDPTILKTEAKIIHDEFVQVASAHQGVFDENMNRMLGALDSLDQSIRGGLASCTLRDIVVLHKAFDYLARQYGFSVTSIEGISPDEEPSPKELARITDLVRIKGVKHIFSETIASPKFSELIAREIGGVTLVLNPIESLTPNEVQSGEDYISVMQMNLNNLQKAMSCN